MRVVTHAVRDHQEAAPVRCRHDDRRVHVGSEDTVTDRDGVLIFRTDAAAMGECRYGPARHLECLAGMAQASMKAHLLKVMRCCPAAWPSGRRIQPGKLHPGQEDRERPDSPPLLVEPTRGAARIAQTSTIPQPMIEPPKATLITRIIERSAWSART